MTVDIVGTVITSLLRHLAFRLRVPNWSKHNPCIVLCRPSPTCCLLRRSCLAPIPKHSTRNRTSIFLPLDNIVLMTTAATNCWPLTLNHYSDYYSSFTDKETTGPRNGSRAATIIGSTDSTSNSCFTSTLKIMASKALQTRQASF